MTYRLDRYEFKFLITRAQQDAIVGCFPKNIVPDRNSGSDAGYRICSLYYDNSQRDCYWEKLRGLRSRRKLRVRLYESSLATATGACFVEIKHKHEGRGVKRRLNVSLEAALQIADGKPAPGPIQPAEKRILDEVHHLVSQRNFRPVCCLRYDRKAYFDESGADSDLRITFDEDIRYRMDDLGSLQNGAFAHRLLTEDDIVMEVKVIGAVPLWLTRVLSAQKCTTAGRSKYCDAIAAGDAMFQKAA